MKFPHTSRPAIVKSQIIGKICSIAGWVIAVFFLIFIVAIITGSPTGKATGASIGFILFAIGVVLIIRGLRTKRMLERFESYMTIILNGNEKSIERIANAVSRPPDFVQKDLWAMIRRNLFIDAFIDVNTSEIILRDRVYRDAYEEPLAKEPADSPEDKDEPLRPESTVVTCKGCGASSKVTAGTVTVCDFCGSQISL